MSLYRLSSLALGAGASLFLVTACAPKSDAADARATPAAAKAAASTPAATPAAASAATTAATPASASEANARAPAAAVSPESFEASGTATAARTTRISPKVGGILRRIAAREGTWVSAGTVLATIDPSDVSLRLEQAQVAHEQAKLALASAESDFKRASEIAKGGAMSEQALEKAELGFKVAQLTAQQADVARRMAEQALADCYIRAPFAGVVTKLFSEEGMYLTTMPPATIATLVDTSVLEVRVPVPERMLALVHKGTPVVVTLPSVGVERQAKVDRLPAVVDTTTRSAEAVITLDNRDGALPANIYARVRFTGVSASPTQGLAKGGTSAESDAKAQ